MWVRGRLSCSMPRVPPSHLTLRLSFWKPTQLTLAEWPAVAAHLPGQPLETWGWCLALERRTRDGCRAGRGPGARGGSGETMVLALSVLGTNMCENQPSSNPSPEQARMLRVPRGELCRWPADPAAALKDLPPTLGASSEQQSGHAGQKRRQNLQVALWSWDVGPLEPLFPCR